MVKASSLSDITTIDIELNDTQEYEFSYQMSTGHTIDTTGSVSVVGTPVFYAESCRVTLSGTGTGKVTIKGYAISTVAHDVIRYYNNTGEDCPVENALITERAHAEAYADWIARYEKRRTAYEVQDRGYPELDLGDRMTIQTAFNEAVGVQVTKHDITFDGGISGSSKFLVGGDR